MYKIRKRRWKLVVLCAALVYRQPHALANDLGRLVGRAFPVINPAVQRERDETRKQILEDELAAEMQRLVKAKSELSSVEGAQKLPGTIGELRNALRRHEANVDSLNQELSRMGQGQRPKLVASDSKILTIKAAGPPIISKYDGYRKAGEQEEDPYDGYAVSSSE